MDYLPPTACSDEYSDELTLGPSFSCDHANIAVGADVSDVNACLYQVAQGRVGDWRWTDEREFAAIPQTFRIGGGVVGVRFRNKTPGETATVQAYLLGPKDPDIQPGTPYSQIPKITFEHNDASIAVAPTLDFEDSATIAWALTDDAPNSRVQVSAVVQGLTAAMVANAADKSAAGEQAFAGPLGAAQLGVPDAYPGGVGANPGVGIYYQPQGFAIFAGNAVSQCIYGTVTGDTSYRLQVWNNGAIYWGSGAATADTQLLRVGVNVLRLSDPRGTAAAGLQIGDATHTGYLEDAGGGLIVAQSSGSKLGFYGAAPIVRPTEIFETSGFTQGSGLNVLAGSTFTGGVGATAYTLGDIVRCLKLLGLITS